MSDSSIDLSEKNDTLTLPPLSRMLMSNEVTIEQIASSEEKAGNGRWTVAKDVRSLLMTTFTFIHAIIFSYGFWFSYTKVVSTLALSAFGAMANAAALVLYFDLAVLIFPVCRTLTSILRRTPLGTIIHHDTSVFFHKMIGWYLVFFASVHTVGHWVNFALLAAENGRGLKSFLESNFGNTPGWSGYVLLVSLGLIAVTSLKGSRLANFERFYYTHHLFVVFFVVSSVHGICWAIREDNASNRASTCSVGYGSIWQWWMYGGFGYLLVERIKREIVGRYKTYISKVIRHPCDVVEIQIKKEKTRIKIGQVRGSCSLPLLTLIWSSTSISAAPKSHFGNTALSCSRALPRRIFCLFTSIALATSPVQ